MESKRLTPPGQQNYEQAYELAYRLAAEQLAGIDDIEQQCRQSGAQYQMVDSQKTIIIQYLNQSYLITLPHIKVSLVGSDQNVRVIDRILMLHYLITAKGTPLANRLITFRELPDGNVYFPTFSQRTVRPLLNCFGREPALLVKAGEKLGGYKAAYGDTALTINAFRRLPITIVLWRGDDEFAPQGNLLFDATISDYLPTEDIAVLCETVTWRLIRSSRGA